MLCLPFVVSIRDVLLMMPGELLVQVTRPRMMLAAVEAEIFSCHLLLLANLLPAPRFDADPTGLGVDAAAATPCLTFVGLRDIGGVKQWSLDQSLLLRSNAT